MKSEAHISELIKGAFGGCVKVQTGVAAGQIWLSAWTNYDDIAVLGPEDARAVARQLLAAADLTEGKPLSCMAKAEPFEPTFTLLGRDAAAPTAVSQWAQARIDHGLNRFEDPQIQEALDLSNTMEAYAKQRKASEGGA